MTSLDAAGLWIGLNVIFLIYISLRVGQVRTRLKINLGDGGNDEMIRAIRTQGNYVEYAPLALIGLLALGAMGQAAVVIHAIGGAFLAARVAHLLGLGMGVWPIGRFIGTLGTLLSLLATAIFLIVPALG
ncbi:MAG: MAPEG family protein [Parvularculaceae bacterium]|nr:MAPEG family protein [Parvularculaceae bacterium]